MHTSDQVQDENTGFTLVSRFKYSSGSRRNRRTTKAAKKEKTLGEILEERRGVLETLGWLQEAREWLETSLASDSLGYSRIPRSIICLGLGSFARSPEDEDVAPNALRKSQYQLLMLTEVLVPVLQERLTATGDKTSSKIPVSVYDPAFNAGSKAHLSSLGYEVLSSDPPLKCLTPALFYMPHAPRSLYEILLAENVGEGDDQGTIPEITLLGNSFSHYADDMREAVRAQIPNVLHIGPRIEERPIPNLEKLEREIGGGVFNETTLQWLRIPRRGDENVPLEAQEEEGLAAKLGAVKLC